MRPSVFRFCAAFLALFLSQSLPAFAGPKIYGLKGPPEANAPFCDGGIPAPAEGYGADGPYAMETATLKNDLWKNTPVTVFFPKGVKTAPVIFFSHAYGATDWQIAYAQFMPHMVSRGYIVVYSPYPTFGPSVDDRYNIMWHGFALAVAQYGARMDLSRVGFTGHSFGGGAAPAMAYKGIVENGWGQNGAFTFMLAPWYSYQVTDNTLSGFPPQVTHLWQVFQDDDKNDQRMAIDIYDTMRRGAAKTIFQYVASENINGCKMPATHALPGRSTALRLKQYSIFRSFDALADYAFNQNDAGLADLLKPDPKAALQPLTVFKNPEPAAPQSNFTFPWDNSRNPRRGERKFN